MITYESHRGGYLVTDLETKKDLLIQTDWNFPGLASNFGWRISAVQRDDDEDLKLAYTILLAISEFWETGDAPIHKSALLFDDHDKPIAQFIRQFITSVQCCQHLHSDGTVTCPDCGLTSTDFISAAREWLDDNEGAEAEDPGCFGEDQ
jgi:hypothetical protein